MVNSSMTKNAKEIELYLKQIDKSEILSSSSNEKKIEQVLS